MGNCYGRERSRRHRSGRTKTAGNGLTQKGSAGLQRGEPRLTEPVLPVPLSQGQDEIDGVPLHDLIKAPTTPPASSNTLPDNATGPLVNHIQDRLKYLAHIYYVPPDEWSTCAYCNNPSGDRYGYFLCSSMSPSLLDTLMEHGWWRTGEVLFKPCFPVVCCPGYALRIPIKEFVLGKKHRRVIRRWAGFLRHGDPQWENRHTTQSPQSTILGDKHYNDHLNSTETESSLVRVAVSSAGVEKVGEEGEGVWNGGIGSGLGGTGRGKRDKVEVSSDVHQQKRRERRTVTPGRGPDPNKPPCRKAKQIREERRQRKLESSGGSSPHPHKPLQPAQPSLHALLADHRQAMQGSVAGFTHKLEVKLLGCNPRNPELTRTLDKAYDLYSKFQEVVHPGKTRFNSASDFEWGFMNSPIVNPPDHLEGSYHMHYYLDDELVMISILDILPKYFVSIYFIYDPAIRFMTPGIYTILVELDLVQQLGTQQATAPQYYALGYYNSNHKVSYKAQFKPQEILCNETNVFVKMESALPKLARKPYTRLAGDELPEKPGRTASIDALLVDTRLPGFCPIEYRYLEYTRLQQLYQQPLKELISEIGSEAAHQMVIAVTHP